MFASSTAARHASERILALIAKAETNGLRSCHRAFPPFCRVWWEAAPNFTPHSLRRPGARRIRNGLESAAMRPTDATELMVSPSRGLPSPVICSSCLTCVPGFGGTRVMVARAMKTEPHSFPSQHPRPSLELRTRICLTTRMSHCSKRRLPKRARAPPRQPRRSRARRRFRQRHRLCHHHSPSAFWA